MDATDTIQRTNPVLRRHLNPPLLPDTPANACGPSTPPTWKKT
jgi:hypothetical protein